MQDLARHFVRFLLEVLNFKSRVSNFIWKTKAKLDYLRRSSGRTRVFSTVFNWSLFIWLLQINLLVFSCSLSEVWYQRNHYFAWFHTKGLQMLKNIYCMQRASNGTIYQVAWPIWLFVRQIEMAFFEILFA